MIAMPVDLDLALRGAHQFADAQARRVCKIEHEPQPLCSRHFPLVAQFQPFGHRLVATIRPR